MSKLYITDEITTRDGCTGSIVSFYDTGVVIKVQDIFGAYNDMHVEYADISKHKGDEWWQLYHDRTNAGDYHYGMDEGEEPAYQGVVPIDHEPDGQVF